MYRLLRFDLYELNMMDKYRSKHQSHNPGNPPFQHSWHCGSRASHSPRQTSQSHSYKRHKTHKRDYQLALV